MEENGRLPTTMAPLIAGISRCPSILFVEHRYPFASASEAQPVSFLGLFSPVWRRESRLIVVVVVRCSRRPPHPIAPEPRTGGTCGPDLALFEQLFVRLTVAATLFALSWADCRL